MNKDIISVLFKIFVFIFIIGCSSEEHKDKVTSLEPTVEKQEINLASAETDLKTGELVFEHRVDNSELGEVAYYLPTESPKSVVIFFDAQGRGFFPLKKYKKLADENNFWLIGSNISKNGYPYDITQKHFEKIKNWIVSTYPDLANKVHLAGFSGGARVAVWMAYDYSLPSIAGFCAGVPNNNKSMVEDKFYYGVTALNDFNYLEMTQLTEGFLSLNNFISIIDGKHEWANVEEIKWVFRWFKMNEIRQGETENNLEIINSWVEEYKREIAENSKAPIEIRYNKVIKGSALFHDVVDISFFETEKTRFRENSKSWGNFSKHKTIASYAERSWNSKFALALRETDPFFHWNGYFDQLEEEIEGASNQILKRGLNRVYSYTSLLSFFQMEGFYQRQMMDSSKLWMQMLESIDDENPDVFYYKALLNADDDFEVSKNLDKAIALGFTDYKKLLNQKEFATINKTIWIESIKKGQ